MSNLTLIIDQKLSKIPWNNISLTSFLIIKFTVVSQESKEWMSFITINLYFLEDREFSMEVFLYKFSDFLWRSTFLTKELIAWEGKNLESFRLKLFMHINHSFIIWWCKSSLTSYINNHNGFFVFKCWEIN